MDITIVQASAMGMASQTPVTPNKFGSVNKAIKMKKNVLEKEIIADVLPSDKAVKSADVKIFVPENKNPVEKIRNPTKASSYTELSLGVNI